MRPDTKQAEKEYLARTGSSSWERMKPFSPPGTDTAAESAQLLHDFAVALLLLQPGPDDRVLDVGAGGCWCSDLLGRLNRHSVAVDISVDMLAAGRARPTLTPIVAVAGDLEALPFAAGSFQKAICLSAIHHVPDIPRAVSEIARVLDDEGMVLFSEPGRGHAEAAVSTAAMRNYGVLEQDILIGDFVQACRDSGFRDVRVKPLAYTLPAFNVTPDEWDAWSRLAASKRPVRALKKMGRAFAELFGLGKKGPLFEETFGISLVRTLRHAVEDHPIIVASKAEGGLAVSHLTWLAQLEAVMNDSVAPGGTIPVQVRVSNHGTHRWPSSSRTGMGHVSLGVQLTDAAGRLLTRDFHRVPLPRDMPPGDAVTLAFACQAPQTGGSYTLKFDLVVEGLTWFETAGSPTVSRPLTVR